MKIEFTEAEMSALIDKARSGNPLPFAFTANGVCTLDSNNPQASWAIAELATMRKPISEGGYEAEHRRAESLVAVTSKLASMLEVTGLAEILPAVRGLLAGSGRLSLTSRSGSTGPRRAPEGATFNGSYVCDKCGCGAFHCEDCDAAEFSFPDYGNRLNVHQIATVLAATGLVDEVGAQSLAEAIDPMVYVLTEDTVK